MDKEARDRIYDEHLVLRCQQEDAAALDELLSRWQEPLWRHARRLTGDSEAAWDVLQEAFLAVSQTIWKLENAACFRTWIYRIVSNKSMDVLRRRQRDQACRQSLASQPPNDGSRRATQGDVLDLRDAVAGLSAEEQSLLSLRYQAELSTNELAGVFDVPAGTIKSRLCAIRQKLRTRMENPHG